MARTRSASLAPIGGAALVLLLASLGLPARAFTLSAATDPVNDAGQQLTVENESVALTFLGAAASLDEEVGVGSPAAPQTLSCKHSTPGLTISGGQYTAATELILLLDTSDGSTWFTGPRSRNDDGFAHARLTQTGSESVLLQWEDLPHGGDRDYNDCVVEIVITPLR